MDNQKDSSEKNIYLREDGILYVDIAKIIIGNGNTEDVKELLEKVKEIAQSLPEPRSFLVKTTPYLGAPVAASQYRKKIAEIVQKNLREISFNKVAMFGGDVTSRVITSFIITATGLKNFKVFKTKKEALEWLTK